MARITGKTLKTQVEDLPEDQKWEALAAVLKYIAKRDGTPQQYMLGLVYQASLQIQETGKADLLDKDWI